MVATSAHIMQTLTDQDAEATVVSIDGVGAHDLISRQAMREDLQGMERDQILPFVGMFYGVHRHTCGRWAGETPHATLVRIWLHRAVTAVQGRLLPCARLEEQGITILGTPVGRPEFVVHALSRIAERHGELPRKISHVKDLQCAWLILLCCGVTRATFHVRSVRPDLTENFAEKHDEQVWRFL